MRVLILWAAANSPNLGVRVLGEGHARLAQAVWPGAEVEWHNYGAACAPVRIGDAREVVKATLRRRDDLREWAQGFDVVLDTRAGDSFADLYGLPRLEGMTAAAEYLKRAGVPVVLGPQTIGPFDTRRGRLLARRSLAISDLVLARDSVSAAQAARLGRPVDTLATDVVFALPQPEAADGATAGAGTAAGVRHDVLLNVSGLLWFGHGEIDPQAYRAQVTELYRRLRAEDRRVGLLAHVLRASSGDNLDDDIAAIAQFTAEVDPEAEVVVPDDLADVRRHLAATDLVIASRMHACLNALSVGTPAVALAYSDKFAPLMGDLGWRHSVDLRGDAEKIVPAVMSSAEQNLADDVSQVRARSAAGLAAAREALASLPLGGQRPHRRLFSRPTPPAFSTSSAAPTPPAASASLSSTGKAGGARDRALDSGVAAVLAAEACAGCGACVLLDPGLRMRQTGEGFLRPERRTGTQPVAGAARVFDAMCPGRRVRAGDDGNGRHPAVGGGLGWWQAWATNEEIRRRGSSGGVLTALATWLVESGRAAGFVGAGAAPDDPTRTTPVVASTAEEILAAAGSRYAPVAVACEPAALHPDSVVACKPCEASALRQTLREQGRAPEQTPLILSFFCAGTPSQHATRTALTQLGVGDDEQVTEMWYRGRGWPGRFTARTAGGAAPGREVSMDYDSSWGKVLGPAVQWRCKICADGVGESADIVAADFWRTDERGYPVFADGEGVSALVARTQRGLDVITAAVEAGVLAAEPIAPEELAAVQPYQVQRRRMLAARLSGTLLAGRAVPRYSGFGLTSQSVAQARQALRTARGSWRRVRAAKSRRS